MFSFGFNFIIKSMFCLSMQMGWANCYFNEGSIQGCYIRLHQFNLVVPGPCNSCFSCQAGVARFSPNNMSLKSYFEPSNRNLSTIMRSFHLCFAISEPDTTFSAIKLLKRMNCTETGVTISPEGLICHLVSRKRLDFMTQYKSKVLVKMESAVP